MGFDNRRRPSQNELAHQAHINKAAAHLASGNSLLYRAEKALIPKGRHGATYEHVPGHGRLPVYASEGARIRAEWTSNFWLGLHAVKEVMRTKTKAEKEQKKKLRRQALLFKLAGGSNHHDVAPQTMPLNAMRASEDPRFMKSMDPEYAKQHAERTQEKNQPVPPPTVGEPHTEQPEPATPHQTVFNAQSSERSNGGVHLGYEDPPERDTRRNYRRDTSAGPGQGEMFTNHSRDFIDLEQDRDGAWGPRDEYGGYDEGR